ADEHAVRSARARCGDELLSREPPVARGRFGAVLRRLQPGRAERLSEGPRYGRTALAGIRGAHAALLGVADQTTAASTIEYCTVVPSTRCSRQPAAANNSPNCVGVRSRPPVTVSIVMSSVLPTCGSGVSAISVST